MSNAASHAATFYREVAAKRKVWTIRDAGGFPAPKTPEGKRSMPFWSTLPRVRKIISAVPAYARFEPHELSWEQFRDGWLTGLKKDDCLVGVNWSGSKAKGYDVEPDVVSEAIEFQIRAERKLKKQPVVRTNALTSPTIPHGGLPIDPALSLGESRRHAGARGSPLPLGRRNE